MKNEFTASNNFLMGGGEMGELMRSYDWAQTSLGAIETWSQSLRSVVSICLNSRFPVAIYWGQDFILLYNDAWRPIVGDKHGWALGHPAKQVWAEIWDDIGAELAGVLATGEGTFHKDDLLSMHRFGYTEECFFEYTFNPVRGQNDRVDGVLNIVSETTYRVLNDRRAQLLRELASKTGIAKRVEDACVLMLETFKSDLLDIPFALLYLIQADGKAYLQGEVDPNSVISPVVIDLDEAEDNSGWSIAHAVDTGQPQVIKNLVSRFGVIPGSPWAEPPQEAMVLPIAPPGQGKVSGALVAVASPRRRLDDQYHDFFAQVAGQVAMAIANAQAYEEERKRAEALAELDRAKTVFFSNVSHEFRTPLSLMLAPTEDALSDAADPLSANQKARIETVQRNGMRLLKLVNTLLDFSRIEAGRVQISYEPTELATLTAELASLFRSAIERAGMQLIVDCPPLFEPVYVDREMWEKIVFNLISNAFKFTFEGEILISLRSHADHIELTVRDTGIGIPETELPHLFKRFHRVQGARGRSIEGSGIGLSLVQELVKLHYGTINVTSVEQVGTCFTLSMPTGTEHLPADRISTRRISASTALNANSYLEEALRWLPQENSKLPMPSLELTSESVDTPNLPTRILLADDNADMRDYIRRLLSQQYQVEAVADGMAALSAVQQQIPDLILTDVMMPNLDGFGLLQALRSDCQTREIPIILLSARAGEESRIEGLTAGADDYLVKPFSARELLARVEANLKLSQLRREATQQEQALRREAETAHQQVETILSSIRDGFYVLDREWNFTYVNDRYCQMVGMEREELLGKNIWQTFPAAVDTHAYVQFHQAVMEQTPRQFEYLYAPWNCWHDHRIYPSPDGLTVFLAEITDRKQAELERERLLKSEQQAREEAQVANRIKDEFLAVLSHELRSPLNPILGWSKLLKTGNLNAVKATQAITTIERNAKLQAELIEDLLDVSRILQGKLRLNVTPVNLAFTIQSAIETVRLSAEAKSIILHTHFPPEKLQVSGDATRLQQIIWNLLSNAVKFTPPEGEIFVQLEQVNHQAQILVRDTGKGIKPEFLPYMFDYFRQEDGATTRKFGGLGLGLAIVRHLVELHGGTVTASSEGEDLGTTFTLTLPLTQSPDRHETAPSTPLVNLNGVRTLIVDDEQDSREFIAFVLEQAGAQISVATSAAEAIAMLSQSQPDVLLSDVGMPDMDGYMLMQQIRALPIEQGGNIRAIALTAYAGDFNQQRAIEAGFQKHIAKPVEPELLIREVASLMN
jgi:PAS domain S-box-containing protein